MAAMASLAVASTCVSMSCVQMKAVGGQCRGVQRWGAGGVALRAAKRSGVEPDLLEEERDMYATAGEGEEDQFPWGKADGSHSWHEGDDGTFMEGIKEVFESAGGPTGGQGEPLFRRAKKVAIVSAGVFATGLRRWF